LDESQASFSPRETLEASLSFGGRVLLVDAEAEGPDNKHSHLPTSSFSLRDEDATESLEIVFVVFRIEL